MPSDKDPRQQKLAIGHLGAPRGVRGDLRVQSYSGETEHLKRLRYADLEMDADLVEMARNVAEHMLTEHADLAERHLLRWLGAREELLKS